MGVSEKGDMGGEKTRGVARVGGGERGWQGLDTPLPRLLLLPLMTLYVNTPSVGDTPLYGLSPELVNGNSIITVTGYSIITW